MLTPGYESDVLHYKQWARHLSLNGVESAYAGKSMRDYVIYPPVFVYVYDLVGLAYRRLEDPRFNEERMKSSRTLTAAIKGVSVAAHLALGATVFFLLSRLHSEKWAAIAATAYLLNPAAIFDTAHWGAPDGFHSLGVVAAYGLGELGLWIPSWVAIVLAAASKPQAWILMPMFGLQQLWLGGPVRTLIGSTLAVLTGVVLILPFVVSQRLAELLTLPAAIASYMPFVSANAHNLWWLIANGQPIIHREAWIGPITYQQVALALVFAFTLAVIFQLRQAGKGRIFMLAAYQTFAWYCLSTQLHENHSFMVLPLLALALPFDRWAWAPLVTVSTTLLLNMTLHDPLFTSDLPSALIHSLTIYNALANMVLLGVWTWRLFAVRAPVRRVNRLDQEPTRADHGYALEGKR
jgi:Gpi18-like mannosyltransferase